MAPDLKQFSEDFVYANTAETPVDTLWTTFKAKKKIVVFQVSCHEKKGSVGRFYFFFFLLFFS